MRLRTPSTLSFCYDNGPLLQYNASSNAEEEFKLVATFLADTVAVHIEALKLVQQSPKYLFVQDAIWLCLACTHFDYNSLSRGKCWLCGESRNYKLPPTHQMPGAIAMIMTDMILISSVHPELSCEESKRWFLKQVLVPFLMRSR